jgi:lysophospholipase L1-like esterase
MKDSTQAALYFGVAGLIILIGSRIAKATAPRDVPPEARRVACLGDSITAASGGYCSLLKPFLPPGSVTKAFGYAGKGAGFIYNHVHEALSWAPTDLVVLAGVNDMPGGGAYSAINNLEKIYAAAHANQVRVVAVQILPWFCYSSADDAAVKATDEVNNWIEDEADVDAVVSTWPLGDVNYCLASKYDDGSGLHPNKAGHRLLAELIADQAFNWK